MVLGKDSQRFVPQQTKHHDVFVEPGCENAEAGRHYFYYLRYFIRVQTHRLFQNQLRPFPPIKLEPMQLEIFTRSDPCLVQWQEEKLLLRYFSNVKCLVKENLVAFVHCLSVKVDFIISTTNCIYSTSFGHPRGIAFHREILKANRLNKCSFYCGWDGDLLD